MSTHWKKCYWLLVVVFFFFHPVTAQQYQRTDQGAVTKVGDLNIEIQFYDPQIVRLIKYNTGTTPPYKSLSVIKAPEKMALQIMQNNDVLSVSSKQMQVTVDRTGRVSFYKAGGPLLLQEKEQGTRFTPVRDGEENTFQVSQSFRLSEEEAIYGLGQHQKGLMNQRNQRLVLKQSNMEIAIPFFQSVKGYGLFWDNYSTTKFTDSADIASFESEVAACIDYYCMQGDDADRIIAHYRTLTGQAPMFPRWVFGFWQSRERYKSQEEPVQVVSKYRQLNVPLDGIVQDWQYWSEDESHWNAMEFGNPRFPDPKRMIDSVHKLNAHMIISVWPSFGNKTKIYQELKEGNMLFDFVTWPINPNVQVYDPFNPAARDIYWRYMHKGIFALGMDGWWLDATEPDQLRPKASDADNKTWMGTFRKVRNAFPLVTTGGVYEHQRGATSGKRVFILTRSAFAGQQRQATMMWSGDVQSRWDVLRAQISAGCNLSLSGLPYWNSDIGGFFPKGNYPNGVKDPAYQELYVRWLQFGAFCPMMRSHGEFTPREIYQFGEKGYWAYDAIEKFIRLRYRFLPYIYSNTWHITASAGTMMRALVMDFPADKNARDLNNQYMFGRSVLVCPVTDSMYTSRTGGETKMDFSTARSVQVYLPSGVDWFDFWTGEKIMGGQHIQKEVPIDIMPLYVKAGSILPLGPVQMYCGEKDHEPVEIRVYEGANGQFTLYEDENDNYNYEKGIYATIPFEWNQQKKELLIGARKGRFPGMQQTRTFNIVLVNKNAGHRKVITYTGKQLKVVMQ